MTISRFVMRNVMRNKRRTVLTVCSIAVSLFLLVTLLHFMKLLQGGNDSDDSHLRLAVRHATSLAETLPASYLPKIRSVDGVRLAMPLTWFGGIYRGEEKNIFANFATDPRVVFDMLQELTLPHEYLGPFISEKTACVVGRPLMERFGWQIGDRITLVSNLYFTRDGEPAAVDLVIRGVLTARHAGEDAQLFFHQDYLDEVMGDQGLVGAYWVKAESTAHTAPVAAAIDEMFRSSSAETKTETEQAFKESFQSMMGNIKLLFGSICSVVVLTILLVVSSTMAMAIRERAPEIAVLKTLGFKRWFVFRLLVGEGLLVAACGGLLGVGGARLFYGFVDLSKRTDGMLPPIDLGGDIMTIGMLVALGIGLASSLVPAALAVRQSVLSGLRQSA